MRRLIKSAFSMMGIEVRQTKKIAEARARQKHQDLIAQWRLLARYEPKTILDIGANEGQCAVLLREAFPDAVIYSFEPLADCFERVDGFLKQNGPGKAFRYALGETNTQQTIHRNEFSPSSSLLPMQDLHRSEFPQTEHSTPETIEVKRLDDLLEELAVLEPLVIKADVQGYEDRVIRGGKNAFRSAAACVLELTSYPLYEDQATFDSVHSLLSELGYAFRGIIDQSTSRIDGRILQFDGLFENTLAVHPERFAELQSECNNASEIA